VRAFIRNIPGLVSLVFLALMSLSAIFAPILSPFPYGAQDQGAILASPGGQHLLGTDMLGRDLLSRLLYGARVSLVVGFLSALTAVFIGMVYGAISGYIGGSVDNWMMRFVDSVYALPDLLVIILISIWTGQGIVGICLALSLVSWVGVARVIRGEVLKLKEEAFVEAARAMGSSPLRIIFKHILPNTIGVLMVALTLRIPAVIFAESSLSFLGLGIQPPLASWGSLAHEGWLALRFYPHLLVFPGVAIFLTVLAFNFLGEGIQETLQG